MNEQEQYDWMVYVSCMTFNHAPYIVDTMNGFTMQETNFPFVCAVVDDASTDGEQAVIKKYLNEYFDLEDKNVVRHKETDDYVLTFARHKTNLNCYFAVFYLKYNHYSIKKPRLPYLAQWRDNAKYIATCEGDDYWINPQKLQKQVDYMEGHPDCSLCFHANIDLYPSGKEVVYKPKLVKSTYTVEDVILGGGGFMATNAMFYRMDLLKKNGQPSFWRNAPIGDYPCALFFASKGTVGYIDDVMSVYRKFSNGSWSVRQNSIKKRIKHIIAIFKMLSDFDQYTSRRYHQAVIKKKRNIIIKNAKFVIKSFPCFCR